MRVITKVNGIEIVFDDDDSFLKKNLADHTVASLLIQLQIITDLELQIAKLSREDK